MPARSLLIALAMASLSPGRAGAADPAGLILECTVSTRYEGYPDSFSTPEEAIRLKIDPVARTLAYWDVASAAYVVAAEAATGDWTRAFSFGDGRGDLTEVALDGTRYRNLTDSPHGRAETTGRCRPAG